MKKGQNCIKIDLCNKIQFTEFLLLNIVDQIFKISTIVETLVTVKQPRSDVIIMSKNKQKVGWKKFELEKVDRPFFALI